MTKSDRGVDGVRQSRAPGLSGRSFRLMLLTSLAGFGGYALLLPVVPLWASTGGAGEFGAGATTGALMLSTVGTQFAVPWALRRWGHRVVLGGGMIVLGAPTPLYAVSADLPLLLAVSLVRGVGFGLVTVAGSALVAELVPTAELGRASARYGIAVGLPQLALLPAGVAVAEVVGFAPLFVLAGALPVVSVLAVPWIRVPERSTARLDSIGDAPEQPARWQAVRAAAGPWLAMLGCSTAQGGLITFLPLAVTGSRLLVPLALLATTAGALVGRLVAGELTDRYGRAGWLLPFGVGAAALGMAAEAAAGGSPAVVLAGAALVGIGFGVVQNSSIVVLFAAAGAAGYGGASAAWNIAYDAGTGLGATGLGALAQPLGFEAAFGASAVLLAATLPVVLSRRPRAEGAR